MPVFWESAIRPPQVLEPLTVWNAPDELLLLRVRVLLWIVSPPFRESAPFVLTVTLAEEVPSPEELPTVTLPLLIVMVELSVLADERRISPVPVFVKLPAKEAEMAALP